jgi:hypothetical protein
LKDKFNEDYLKNKKKRKKEEGKEHSNTIASELLEKYTTTMEKLVYYVMNEGW